MAQSIRIPYWDNAKSFLIFLVVLGHTGTAMGDNWLSVIYAFHMPLFVFISGYFSRKKETLWEMIGKLCIIYLVFNTLYIGLDLVLGEALSITRILTPSFALWYLLSLIIWRVLLFLLPQFVLDNKGLILFITIVLSLLSGYIKVGTVLSFQRTFAFMPFFFAGFYAKQLKMINPDRQMNIRIILPLMVFIVFSIMNYYKMPVFYANHYYVDDNGISMRITQSVIAAILSWSVLAIIPNIQGLLTKMGESSLIIYLLHPPIIKGAKMFLAWRGIEANPIIALIITILTVVLLTLISKVKIFRLLR